MLGKVRALLHEPKYVLLRMLTPYDHARKDHIRTGKSEQPRLPPQKNYVSYHVINYMPARCNGE